MLASELEKAARTLSAKERARLLSSTHGINGPDFPPPRSSMATLRIAAEMTFVSTRITARSSSAGRRSSRVAQKPRNPHQ